MCNVLMSIPDAVQSEISTDQTEIATMVRKMAALGFYTTGQFSVGCCAEIAEMPIADFIAFLSENHISIFRYDSKEELLKEMQNA